MNSEGIWMSSAGVLELAPAMWWTELAPSRVVLSFILLSSLTTRSKLRF
jgi:hypothetical protein